MRKGRKKNYNPCLKNITDSFTKEQMEKGVGSMFCANVPENSPKLDQAPCETIFAGAHNADIVLGRDRDQSWLSGTGGKGMTENGMIDLVAGRAQLLIAQNKIKNKHDPCAGLEVVGPNFATDASRIYITQKTLSIDKYFGIAESSKAPSSIYKSAIGIKSDHVRVIGREHVKIHVGPGDWDGFDSNTGETNCLGQSILEAGIIEFQAGGLPQHPVVLGKNLVEYLKKQNEATTHLRHSIYKIDQCLSEVNGVLALLTSGPSGIPNPFVEYAKTFIEELSNSISKSMSDHVRDMNYLNSFPLGGDKNILSLNVFTT